MPFFKINLPTRWVLPSSILFLLALLIVVELPVLQVGGAVFYPLDDAYSRMAIAKNLSLHGVWGFWPQEFCAASSSVLYPLLLAGCFKIFGVQAIIPLLINLVAGLGFIVSLRKWLVREGLTPIQQLLVLLIVIYAIPLHVIIADGMEHTLEIWVSFLFMMRFCAWVSSEKNASGRGTTLPWDLFGYGLLLTAIRYEGLFLVGMAILFMLYRRQWASAILLLIAAALPIALFGLYSIAHDGYFIPNSLLIKAIPLPLEWDTLKNFFKEQLVDKLLYPYPTRGALAAGRLLIVLPLTYWIYYPYVKGHQLFRNILFFTLSFTFLHLILANANLYYRYEAYLIACGLVVPATLLTKYGLPLSPLRGRATRWMAAWTVLILFFPFLSRSWTAWQESRDGFVHEYEYDCQAARFLHNYYNDATVVMDETGMSSFLSNGRKLDVMTGIAYMDIVRTRVDGFTRLQYVAFLLKRDKPVIALIADRKYHRWLTQGWTKLGTWYTNAALPLGESELDIYAVEPAAVNALRSNLKAFRSQMPPEIKVDLF